MILFVAGVTVGVILTAATLFIAVNWGWEINSWRKEMWRLIRTRFVGPLLMLHPKRDWETAQLIIAKQWTQEFATDWNAKLDDPTRRATDLGEWLMKRGFFPKTREAIRERARE